MKTPEADGEVIETQAVEIRPAWYRRLGRKLGGILRSRASKDAEEFVPDAILLESAGPGIPSQTVWIVILTLLLGGVIWASTSKIDKIVTAQGRVVTAMPTISMKPLDRAVIKTVNVVQGQAVKKGQTLFTFDITYAREERMRLEEQRDSLRANLERLRAEQDEIDFVIKRPDDENYKMQKTLYDARTEYYRERLSSYDENITRIRGILDTMTESMVKHQERMKKLEEIEAIYQRLFEQEATSRMELLQIQVSVTGMAIQLDQQEMQIIEYRQQLLALQAERNSFLTDWKRNLVEELVNVDRQLMSYEREIPKAKMSEEYTELRAPVDAVVLDIAPFQEGSAVREAESLITLVPTNVRKEIEIDIHPKDVGLLRLGDMAQIKFDAYPFQRFGTLDGKLRSISATTFDRSAQEAAQSIDGQSSYYKGFMEFSGKFAGATPNMQVIPGMRVTAEIRVGERSIMSYILYPFTKAMDESLREP